MIDAVKQLLVIVQSVADSEGEGDCYWCGEPYWGMPHASECLVVQARAALAASATLEARLAALERLLRAVRERQAVLTAMDIDDDIHHDAWWEQVTAASVRLVDSDKAIAAALAELDGEVSQ